MLKGYKYRIYPNKSQIKIIKQNIDASRFVYNYYLNKQIIAYKNNNQKFSTYDCINDLSKLKKLDQHSWLKLADSQALQQSLMSLDNAYNQFFNRIKKKNKNIKFGFPKFKRKKKCKWSYKTTNIGSIKIADNFISLRKLGKIKIKIDKLPPNDYKIKSAVITRTRSDKYFVSVLVECNNDKSFELTGKSVGIDLGLKNFIITSEGLKISNPKYFVKSQNKLAKLQRELSRKTRGSSNYNKAEHKIAKLSEHVANQRNDFLQKLSTSLVKQYDTVCTENLNVAGLLKNHKLAKSISDVSWSMFISMLTYKCDWYNKQLVKVDRFFPSTKTCNICGYINQDLTLKDRDWICPNCNTNLDRDINAAINILNEGLKCKA